MSTEHLLREATRAFRDSPFGRDPITTAFALAWALPLAAVFYGFILASLLL